MQELLRNQVITPRVDSNDSHQQAALAVSRLRSLQSSGTSVQAASASSPAATTPPPAAPVSYRLAARRRPPLLPLVVAITAGLAFFVMVLPFALPVAPVSELAADDSLGAGYVQLDRSMDRVYQVRDGDTLAEIAYVHGLDFSTLAAFNRLANPDQLIAGQTLVIPSLSNEKTFRSQGSFQTVALKSGTRSASETSALLIKAEKQYDGTALTAHFSVESPGDAKFSSYQWDLGNGKMAFRASPYWSYEQPGTYTVKLRARLNGGGELVSNPLYIDVPHPGSYQGANQQFITLNNLNESFRLPGDIEGISGYQSVDEAPVSKVGQDGSVGVYQVTKPGFYAIELQDGTGDTSTAYLFASPLPSVHSERSDMNWYRTQFNTGTLSNCGPSSVAMAYAWAKGGYLPVSTVRQAVGWRGNGSTSYEELIRVLNNNDVANRIVQTKGADDLFRIIDRGDIAIILINTGGIRRSAGGLSDLFGRYYSDVVGHYVVLKGYSTDHKYLIIQDPIPSDWSSNAFRFADGISMSGRNRYYAVEDVMNSLRSSSVLEISRD